MSVFQHPHLTRGIVKTAWGSFIVKRGLVDVPDEIGEELGWQPVDTDSGYHRELPAMRSRDYDESPDGRRMASRPSAMLKAEREARARLIRAKAASRRASMDDAQSAD
jgi:hypothetical protein